MNAVTNNSFYLRKVENPTPYKNYLRRGLADGETGYLSPALYIGDGLFYDYIGNFRAFDKSEFWTFASASEYRVTGTPHEPGMTPREYVKDAVEKCLQSKQKYVDELAAAMEPRMPDKRMTELKKASEPLQAYLKAHGDPYTSVIVTQYGATETQDERRVTFDSGKPANQATPKADLQQLDRAIRDLSGVIKDDRRGLHAYFDGVDMTYILECLKKYREMVGGEL